MIWSGIVHAALLLLALAPLMYLPNPPPEQEGIQLAFGAPDAGMDDSPATTEAPESSKPEPTPEPPKPETKPTPKTTPTAETKKVVTTDDPDAIALKKKKAEEAKKKAEADAKKKAAAEEQRKKAEADAKAKAEAEAKKKAAEEEAKRREEAKNKFKFPGSGQGTGGSAGNQGDPNGDPNASKLEGISTGSGQIGGGLSNRGVANRPTITDNSQETGRVVVKVCADKDGKVTEATYTQSGSTTTSSRLKSLAVNKAKEFRFEASEVDRQCGTITFDFKLQ
jgi:TolA protein